MRYIITPSGVEAPVMCYVSTPSGTDEFSMSYVNIPSSSGIGVLSANCALSSSEFEIDAPGFILLW